MSPYDASLIFAPDQSDSYKIKLRISRILHFRASFLKSVYKQREKKMRRKGCENESL